MAPFLIRNSIPSSMWSGFQVALWPHLPLSSLSLLQPHWPLSQSHKEQAHNHLRAFILVSPLSKTFFPYLFIRLSLLIFLKKYAWILLHQRGLPWFSYITCPLPPLCSISWTISFFFPADNHHLTYCMFTYCWSLQEQGFCLFCSMLYFWYVK